MRCEQARQLFDAYLDGDLPPALATELGAHRVRCSECRQALALLEVSGHIIASDRDPVSLGEGFADRLLSCMETRRACWPHRVRRGLYIAGPLAAAAVVALAFLGVFDRGHDTNVASDKIVVEAPLDTKGVPSSDAGEPVDEAGSDASAEADRALEEWVERAQENLNARLERGEKLRESFDLTILQWLDIFNGPNDAPEGEDRFPGPEIQLGPDPGDTVPADDQKDQVEDL